MLKNKNLLLLAAGMAGCALPQAPEEIAVNKDGEPELVDLAFVIDGIRYDGSDERGVNYDGVEGDSCKGGGFLYAPADHASGIDNEFANIAVKTIRGRLAANFIRNGLTNPGEGAAMFVVRGVPDDLSDGSVLVSTTVGSHPEEDGELQFENGRLLPGQTFRVVSVSDLAQDDEGETAGEGEAAPAEEEASEEDAPEAGDVDGTEIAEGDEPAAEETVGVHDLAGEIVDGQLIVSAGTLPLSFSGSDGQQFVLEIHQASIRGTIVKTHLENVHVGGYVRVAEVVENVRALQGDSLAGALEGVLGPAADLLIDEDNAVQTDTATDCNAISIGIQVDAIGATLLTE